MNVAGVEPIQIAVPDDAIADLNRRLREALFPGEIRDAGWQYGADLAYMRALCSYWANGFDWRKQEAELNRQPHFAATIDGFRLHFIHAQGKGPKPLPLVFSHGWPGSIYEVHKILGPLTNPAAYGGDERDAFTVVAPSLPGYGFSEIPAVPGYGQGRTAELFDGLMRWLGYARYGVQGGDWGAVVSALMAERYGERVVGAHMNMAFVGPVGEAEAQSDEEKAYQRQAEAWRFAGGGYMHIQGTKPQTLAYGLTDSPSGLAAWITEKWRDWSDCDGDIEAVFSMDEILTNISIYWFTGTILSSVRYYYEMYHNPKDNRLTRFIETPCGFSIFPREIISAPKTWVERGCNVVDWREHEEGGHFAALEQPEQLVEDIRAFFRPLR